MRGMRNPHSHCFASAAVAMCAAMEGTANLSSIRVNSDQDEQARPVTSALQACMSQMAGGSWIRPAGNDVTAVRTLLEAMPDASLFGNGTAPQDAYRFLQELLRVVNTESAEDATGVQAAGTSFPTAMASGHEVSEVNLGQHPSEYVMVRVQRVVEGAKCTRKVITPQHLAHADGKYELRGRILHEGNGHDDGHYLAEISTHDGWHLIDEDRVSSLSALDLDAQGLDDRVVSGALYARVAAASSAAAPATPQRTAPASPPLPAAWKTRGLRMDTAMGNRGRGGFANQQGSVRRPCQIPSRTGDTQPPHAVQRAPAVPG